MAFLFPFIVFVQPGILWPQLAPYKPALVMTAIALVAALFGRRKSTIQMSTQLGHSVFISVCAFVFFQTISVYYGGAMEMANMFGYWLTYASFVGVSILLIRDNAGLYRFIAGTLAGSAVVVAYGLWAVATHSPKLAGNRAGAYGMYENHNDYTFIIVMTLPFAYMAIPLVKNRLYKLFLIVYIGACILGTLLSLSRGGMLVLVIMLGMLFWQTTSGGRRIAGLTAFAVVAVLAVGYQFAAREENQAGSYTAEDAKNSRYELWRAARQMFQAHPLLGVGSGRFSEYSREYADLSHDQKGKVSHNTYLEVLTGSGLLGFASFMMMIWGIVRESSIKWGNAASTVPRQIRIATQVCMLSLMLRAMLDAKAHDWSFYFLAVVAVALGTLTAPKSARSAASAAATPEAKEPASLALPVRPAVYSRRS
jgi:O-antigen ligase